MEVSRDEMIKRFSIDAIEVMTDFNIWVDDYIAMNTLFHENEEMLKAFKRTLQFMIPAYYCTLMCKEEYDEIVESFGYVFPSYQTMKASPTL